MTKRVLVVDDDDLNREVIAAMLEDQDCVFDEAENGLDAVARASNAHYDVIYMDIMMPVMDGVSATQQIRKKLGASRTLIIAVTAKDLVGNAKSWAAAGFDDYVRKPFIETELLKPFALETFDSLCSMDDVT